MDKPKIPLQHPSATSEVNRCLPEVSSSLRESLSEELLERNELSQEAEYSAWESRVAKLVGLEDKSLNSDAEEEKDFVREQLAPEGEIEVPAKQTLSSNPFAKLGLVGSGTLAIVLLVGIFLSQITNIGQTKPSQNEFIASEPQKPSTTESYMLELEGEVEILKTKLALAKQAEAVKIAQQTLRQETPKPEETPRANLIPPRTPEPKPTVVPPVNEPRVVYVERPAPQPTPPSPSKTEPDPLQEWNRLAKLGSYGQVSVASEPQITRQRQNLTTEPQTQIAQQTQNPATPPQTQITRQKQTSFDDNLAASARPALKQNRKSVAVGSSAKAVLATAVFGETTTSRSPNQQEGETVFVVNLKEPLEASNGEVALPADTQLLVKIGSLSERGLVRLKVDKVIMPEDNDNSERSLPSNAIAIHSPGGKPLLAEKFPNRSGSIALKDTQMFLLGGLGKAAELYNRTDTEVIINDGGSTTVSSDNSQRNLSAGAVQGGIEALVPVLAQRNQQQISQMMQRTDVWLVPAGTKVELYVNREIQL